MSFRRCFWSLRRSRPGEYLTIDWLQTLDDLKITVEVFFSVHFHVAMFWLYLKMCAPWCFDCVKTVHFNIWLTLWWLHLNIYFTLMFWLHCALQYFDYIVKSSAPWCFFDCTVKTWIAEHTRNTVFEWCDVRHTSHWVIKADCFSFIVKHKVWNLFCFFENSCWLAVSCKTSINWCPGNAIYHQGSKDLCHLQSQISWLRVQSFSCEGPLDWMWLL